MQKAPDGYETMDVDFVPASESPMVQADQRFNMVILKEDWEAEAQLDAERAHALPSRLSCRRNRMSWM